MEAHFLNRTDCKRACGGATVRGRLGKWVESRENTILQSQLSTRETQANFRVQPNAPRALVTQVGAPYAEGGRAMKPGGNAPRGG